MADKAKTTFELINDLIIAISNLLWPILVIAIVLLFRKEISEILKRLKKGKFLGQELELELDKEIEEFKAVTKEASENVPQNGSKDESQSEAAVDNILNKSAEDPKIGIILLSQEIEREVNSIIGSLGLAKELKFKSVKHGFEILEQKHYISKSILQSVNIFWDLRNKIIHGRSIEDDSYLIRVLDTGTILLKTLKLIPRETHLVFYAGIELYSDANCIVKRSGVYGLMLENFSNQTNEKHYSIFPTLNKSYNVGDEVSWEWSFDNVWGETWYIDPITSKIEMAWSSAAEFTGRPIKDL